MEFIITEVLVLGGGVAGMRAAISAREEGAEVMLLSRGKVGKSGSSAIANTGHRIFPKHEELQYKYIEDTLKSGQGLAEPELLEVLAGDSYEAVLKLQEWGCPVEFEFFNGQPVYARCPERSGLLITEKLRQHCEAVGVHMREGYSVLQLVKRAERVIGAYVAKDAKIYCVLAKAVVLATGGIGQLYFATDNPFEITGEGVALAWQCGAEMIDLEFVQFYPYQLSEPEFLDVHMSTFLVGGMLINEAGRRFMDSYPQKELETWDLVSREMFLQQSKIFLDLTRADLKRLMQKNKPLFDLYLNGQELLMEPIQHFFMGGVRIDSCARSTVAGLFICGEAAGGIHGANRLGGNALTECNVFGQLAGRSAAAEAGEWDYELADLNMEALREAFYVPREGEDSFGDLRYSLSKVMWDAVGIIRDGQGLTEALHWINHAMVQLAESRPVLFTEWYETRNMLITANLITMAAHMREESRGAHFRLDFPEKAQDWAGHIVICGEKLFLERPQQGDGKFAKPSCK